MKLIYNVIWKYISDQSYFYWEEEDSRCSSHIRYIFMHIPNNMKYMRKIILLKLWKTEKSKKPQFKINLITHKLIYLKNCIK